MNTNYKNLIVWQKAIELVVEVYRLTDKYPNDERFGLIAHSRKSAISVPSNIAEGRRRGSEKEFRRFLSYSFASGAELETQIEIAKRLKYAQLIDYKKVDLLLDEVMRMLNKLINKR